MAPTKFEKIIKEKLENRRLDPLPDAWNRLSERLENQEEKQKSFPYWQLAVAASIIGVLLVASQFYKNDIIETKPKIVVTPEVIEQNEGLQIILEKTSIGLNDPEQIKALENTQSTENNYVLKKKNEIEQAILINNMSIPELKKETKKHEQTNSKEFTFEDQKIKELVAQVQQLKEIKTEVTDADIDALLLKAQKEIRLKRIYNKNTQVVDANALLQDVEAELEQSFRGKVFQALKENFISIKTTVAQRNN